MENKKEEKISIQPEQFATMLLLGYYNQSYKLDELKASNIDLYNRCLDRLCRKGFLNKSVSTGEIKISDYGTKNAKRISEMMVLMQKLQGANKSES